jgi:hypothetical protein
MFGSIPQSPPPAQPQDLRQNLSSSEIWAYWDVRPGVEGAQGSATLSGTLAVTGSTLPTVTMSGPVSPPREVRIDYTTGGARGTAVYRIQLDGGSSVLTGVTSGVAVDIGRSNSISFGNDANYTINTSITTATIHQTKVVGLQELTGRANCTLVDTLSGAGHRYEAFGMNNKYPSLYSWTSALNNDSGVPALVSGNDVAFEVWMLYEIWSLTTSSFARVPWAFVNQTDTAKSFVDTFSNGPLAASPSIWGLQRKNSATTPVTKSLTTTVKIDQAPRVMRWIVSSTGNVWISGRPGLATPVTLASGGATTVNRFLVGGLKLGTSAFLASAWDQARWSALAITPPLGTGRELAAFKAFT